MDIFGHGRQAVGLALVALALVFAALAERASAQGAVKSVHKDSQIRCDTPPGAKTEQCALIQSVTAEDRANVGLTVIMLKTADQKSRLMRVVAPLGVLLPSGLGLKIDQADIGRAGFVRCLPHGCIAEGIMDGDLVRCMTNCRKALPCPHSPSSSNLWILSRGLRRKERLRAVRIHWPRRDGRVDRAAPDEWRAQSDGLKKIVPQGRVVDQTGYALGRHAVRSGGASRVGVLYRHRLEGGEGGRTRTGWPFCGVLLGAVSMSM